MKATVDSSIQIKNGAVTFLDVLGWKGIWTKQQDAINILHGLVVELKDFADYITSNISETIPEMRGQTTSVLSISDTIAIFTPGDPKHSLEIHAGICQFAIPESVRRKIPLRGATSYGEFSIKEHIMVGPAVDESASWHEATDWIGVIFTPSAIFNLKDDIPPNFAKYDRIPFKKKCGLNYCVDWKMDQIDDVNRIFLEMGPHIPEIAPKYLNTLDFLNRNPRVE